jgi:hypothetical protein
MKPLMPTETRTEDLWGMQGQIGQCDEIVSVRFERPTDGFGVRRGNSEQN